VPRTAELLKNQVYLQLGEHARLLEVAQLHDRLGAHPRAFPQAAAALLPSPTREAQGAVAHHQG